MQGGGGDESGAYLHYHDSGLFIGEFGGSTGGASHYGAPLGPGINGNNFSSTLVASGSTLYLYDGGEAGGRGPQRWSITGTSTENLMAGSLLP